MNKSRRAILERIHKNLNALMEDLEVIRDDEADALSNLPESLQDGEKGEAMQSAIDELEDAQSSIQDAIDAIERAVE